MDENFGGEELLITIVSVGTIVLFCIIWTNRHISRMLLIAKKGPHTNVGSDASKQMKRKIERYFDLVSKICVEPKLLSDQGCKDTAVMSSYVERRDESTYTFRRKAFDLMSCLNDLLCRVDVCLAAKPGQSVGSHMADLQKPPYAPFADCKDLCERVVAFYEHARYGLKPFERSEYEKFAEEMEKLTRKVYDTLQVPGSLVVPTNRAKISGSASSVISGGKSIGMIDFSIAKDANITYWGKDDETSRLLETATSKAV